MNEEFVLDQKIREMRTEKAAKCIRYINELMDGEKNQEVKNHFEMMEIVLRNLSIGFYHSKVMQGYELFEEKSSQDWEIAEGKLDKYFMETKIALGD